MIIYSVYLEDDYHEYFQHGSNLANYSKGFVVNIFFNESSKCPLKKTNRTKKQSVLWYKLKT